MPSLLKEDLTEILDLTKTNLTDYKYFVETGTWMGETILRFENTFEKLFTIEVSEYVYNEFQKKNYDKNKIKSILGDSSEMIQFVVEQLDDKTIFFLDGHYSSGITGKGKKDVPLYEEITTINNNFNFECIIIIDDLRLFGTKLNEDWSEISNEKIFSILDKRMTQNFSLKDRLIIKLKKI